MQFRSSQPRLAYSKPSPLLLAVDLTITAIPVANRNGCDCNRLLPQSACQEGNVVEVIVVVIVIIIILDDVVVVDVVVVLILKSKVYLVPELPAPWSLSLSGFLFPTCVLTGGKIL